MDLPNRKAYLFSIEIWPQEVFYITGLLILGAMGLFFVTSLFGRIWCGYTCPHTVFVDLFVKVEAYFQGDRNARMRLDQDVNDPTRFKKKLLTHICWILISFSFAFGWVCYFYDAPQLLKDVLTLNVSPGGAGWLIGLTVSTYLFAGFVRQRVCIYMCPYGRFQSAMLDNDSSVVSYHAWRGEPRGKLSDKGEYGDCIDCGKCVVVCPMDIDIREGLQLPCIGCGLCIDACNSVMEKIKRPEYLIAYDSINSTQDKIAGNKSSKAIFKVKTLLFVTVFIIVSGVLFYALLTKSKVTLSIIRDRDALYTVLPDGEYRNIYTIKINNKSSKEQEFALTIEGLDSSVMKIDKDTTYSDQELLVTLEPEEERSIKLFVKSKKPDLAQKTIYFHLIDVHSKDEVKTESIFVTAK
jgi:cytochrome c oxidase accessory protein FixG